MANHVALAKSGLQLQHLTTRQGEYMMIPPWVTRTSRGATSILVDGHNHLVCSPSPLAAIKLSRSLNFNPREGFEGNLAQTSPMPCSKTSAFFFLWPLESLEVWVCSQGWCRSQEVPTAFMVAPSFVRMAPAPQAQAGFRRQGMQRGSRNHRAIRTCMIDIINCGCNSLVTKPQPTLRRLQATTPRSAASRGEREK